MADYETLAGNGGIYLERRSSEGIYLQPATDARKASLAEARELLGLDLRIVYQRPHAVSVHINPSTARAMLVSNRDGEVIGFGSDLTALVGQHVLIVPGNARNVAVTVFPRKKARAI